MSSIEKKLDALIDALGFDVVEEPTVETERFTWASGNKGVMETVSFSYALARRPSEECKHKMAYEALRNQIQSLMDVGCISSVFIDLRKQIELCERYINE